MVFHRSDFERVARVIDPADEAGERITLQALKSEDGRASLPLDEIAAILDGTRSNRLRNAAALALADRHAPGLAERLATLLASPDIAKSAGTLLYALDRTGGPLPADAFLNLIMNGSYEARAEALEFLVEDRLTVAGPDQARDLLTKLLAIRASDDAEAAGAAREALTLASASRVLSS